MFYQDKRAKCRLRPCLCAFQYWFLLVLQMAEYHPTSGLLLRIRADDPNARCQLGNKYGAEMADVPLLLSTAKELSLHVRGVSFHVGSGAKNPLAFRNAIEQARKVGFQKGLGWMQICVVDCLGDLVA